MAQHSELLGKVMVLVWTAEPTRADYDVINQRLELWRKQLGGRLMVLVVIPAAVRFPSPAVGRHGAASTRTLLEHHADAMCALILGDTFRQSVVRAFVRGMMALSVAFRDRVALHETLSESLRWLASKGPIDAAAIERAVQHALRTVSDAPAA